MRLVEGDDGDERLRRLDGEDGRLKDVLPMKGLARLVLARENVDLIGLLRAQFVVAADLAYEIRLQF